MHSRRLFLLHSAAFVLVGGSGASAQSFINSRPEDILIGVAEKLQSIAENAAMHALYSGLAFSQLQFRVASNFNGYENSDNFAQPARSAMTEVLFDEKSQVQVMSLGSDFEALKDNLDRLASAFESERGRFLEFSEQLSKDALELGLPAPTPDLLLAAAAYYTVFAVTVRKNEFSTWFDGSWVWPFCFRQR